jgi:hypothetical protein
MMKRILGAGLIVISLIGSMLVTAAETSLTRVLFIGNSYLYYNDSLHNHVKRMASERFSATASRDFQYKSATIGGARLKHHDIEWLLTPGKIGVDRPFQAVIMQGGSFEPLTADTRKTFVDTASQYAEKVRAIGGKPFLYMTHAYVPPHRRAEPGVINLISDTYRYAGQEAKAEVIPVGLAFERSYKERPNFSLHMAFDGTHPNLRGTFLGAYVTFFTLYGETVDTLDYDYFGRMTKDEIVYLQRIAKETVADFILGRSD